LSIDFSWVMASLVLASGGLVCAGRLGRRRGREWAESGVVQLARSLFPIFLIVFLIRSFLIEPFRIPSASMMPTLLAGDLILVNKFDYGIRLPLVHYKIVGDGRPRRGDVIVFRYPLNPRLSYIKRVIGLPGDRVRYHEKNLYINGMPVERAQTGGLDTEAAGNGGGHGRRSWEELLPGRVHEILVDPRQDLVAETDVVVPEAHYFVLGDNRDNSRDSRFWGFVPDDHLVGKAFLIWLSWNGGVVWQRIGKSIQ